MRSAFILAAAAGLVLGASVAKADDVHVGVGAGPVGAGVTVGERHERERTTIVKPEEREHTTIIKREREPDRKVIIHEHDHD
jgi:hypothetical protein